MKNSEELNIKNASSGSLVIINNYEKISNTMRSAVNFIGLLLISTGMFLLSRNMKIILANKLGIDKLVINGETIPIEKHYHNKISPMNSCEKIGNFMRFAISCSGVLLLCVGMLLLDRIARIRMASVLGIDKLVVNGETILIEKYHPI